MGFNSGFKGLMSLKPSVLSRLCFIGYHCYGRNITTWSVISFSASLFATVHNPWRVVEYLGGNSPWSTSRRVPHIWRSVLQLGQNCIFRCCDTLGLWKYHNGICDVDIERSAIQSEVRNILM